MDQDEQPIGDLIRDTRERVGVSQRQLANQLATVSGNDSIAREHVARWERGSRIPAPYWRHWLSLTLQLNINQLDRAAIWSQILRADQLLDQTHEGSGEAVEE